MSPTLRSPSRFVGPITAGAGVLAACTTTSESSTTESTLEVETTDAPVSPQRQAAPLTGPEPTYGAATVDGDSSEWGLAADFFADMFEAGKPDKPVLSKLCLRYACETETLYVLVVAEPDWLVINTDDDNFVKVGNSQKLVDGATSAVADRAVPITIVCQVGSTTTSTLASSTTTTTSTVAASSTTSTSLASTTTSTTESSTTSVGSTSTTLDSSTTTLDVAASSVATSTTTDVSGETLPHTGPGGPLGPVSQAVWLGLLLVMLGGLTVRVVRDRS